jgi:serine/threonine protein kinase
MLFVDSDDFAPEYCRSHYSQRSDIFSFGLILSEVLTCQPVFSKELTPHEIDFMAGVKHELLDILKFVLPSAFEPIKECWDENPIIGYPSIRSWIDSRT